MFKFIINFFLFVKITEKVSFSLLYKQKFLIFRVIGKNKQIENLCHWNILSDFFEGDTCSIDSEKIGLMNLSGLVCDRLNLNLIRIDVDMSQLSRS